MFFLRKEPLLGQADKLKIIFEVLFTPLQVAYKVDSRNAYKEISTGASENNYTLSNLKPVTKYNIKIAAKNNAG